jgi:hypothetical protein
MRNKRREFFTFQDQRINRVIRMQSNNNNSETSSTNRDRRSLDNTLNQQDSMSERSDTDNDSVNTLK